MRRTLVVAVLAAVLSSFTLSAHHSFSATYNNDKSGNINPQYSILTIRLMTQTPKTCISSAATIIFMPSGSV